MNISEGFAEPIGRFAKSLAKAHKAASDSQWDEAASLYGQAAECLIPGGPIRGRIEAESGRYRALIGSGKDWGKRRKRYLPEN